MPSGGDNGSHAGTGHFATYKAQSMPEWGAVDSYVMQHLHPASRSSSAALRHALDHAVEQGLPDISVPPSLGKFLSVQCLALQATQMLEVGTLGGYSSIWMASENPNLHITTLELDPHHAKVARDSIAHAGLSERITVIEGPAIDSLAKLEADGRRFDLVFIDADKINNWHYFDAGVRMGHRGTMIIVDNIVRRGRLADASLVDTDNGVKGARNVVERAGSDKRVVATVLQIVSEKGYDGNLVATVL